MMYSFALVAFIISIIAKNAAYCKMGKGFYEVKSEEVCRFAIRGERIYEWRR